MEFAEKSFSIAEQIEAEICVLAERGGPIIAVVDLQPHMHKAGKCKLPAMCAKMEECAQKSVPSKQIQSTILTRNCHGSHALATDKNLETVELEH